MCPVLVTPVTGCLAQNSLFPGNSHYVLWITQSPVFTPDVYWVIVSQHIVWGHRMLRTYTTTALALVIAIGATTVSAQNLRDADQPAEFPPSSYTGKQYVDSKGCVFVRAGFDGAVTWIPRVNRKRKVLCGFSPTFASAPPKPEIVEPPKVVAAAPAPEQVQPVVRVAPKPVPPKPRVVATAPVRAAPLPTVKPLPTQVVVAKPRPVQAAPTRVVTAGGACPGVSGISQRYLQNNGSHKIRCGPQADHPGNYATNGVLTGGNGYNPGQVVRVSPGPEIKPPPGYKAAFEEDRFHPNRGVQTREGFYQMRLVWTAGTPRRLVDQNSGRDVTSLFPGLRFPFINLGQQKKYVAANGWPASSGVVISTKNTPPTQVAPTPTPSGHRYVQVGTFVNESNARATAGRLQKLGLPARIGTYKKKGKTYRVVLAGPYSNGSNLQSALAAARRGGFSDAFTRK